MQRTATLAAIAWLALAPASIALAQPEGSPPPPPPNDNNAPPPAPEASWAPPLPEEPPAQPAPAQPPAQGQAAQPSAAQGTQGPSPRPGAPPSPPYFAQLPTPDANAAPEMPPPGNPQAPSQIPESELGPTPPDKPSLEVYGFAMLDLGYDFGEIGDPQWEDVLRPTKLPAFDDQFGRGGRWFEGVRQSRFGIASNIPTDYGPIETRFEFEMFGVGPQAGQTTFRLRHFYGEWHNLLGGQTWSPFMDPDVFPDSIEYWGPNGMVFFRNIQLAYSPYKTDKSDVTIAVERPGASADSEAIGSRFDLSNVVPRFPAPDISADVKLGWSWGYVRAAGIFRYIRWDDLAPTPVIQGHVYGWGVNVSSNLEIKPALLKLQVVYGNAIENYMNDAGADVGPAFVGDPGVERAVKGEGLPVLGIVAFADLRWSECLTSTAGYSFVWIDNSSGQAPDAFHIGHYALGNLLVHPTENLMFGPEFQFGRRENFKDGFGVNDYRLQFSIKYSFAHKTGGA